MAVMNRVSAVIQQSDIDEITAAIGTINSKLPFLVDLSPDEIRELPKFGDKSVAFVKKAMELVNQTDSFLPRSFNIEEFRKDAALYDSLYSIIQPLKMLLEKLNDTYYLAGSEAYSAALVVYSGAKNARGDLPGMDDLLDEFSRRFARKTETPVTESKE